MKPELKKAFTLIEVVLALALGGLILVASSSLLMSITQLWIKEEKLDDFQDHVYGVGDFLRKHLKSAQYSPDSSLPKTQWGTPPRVSLGIDEHYLMFYVNTPHPIFDTDNLSPVLAYLKLDKYDGLVLVWHSYEKESEKDRGELPVYRRVLSPLAKDWKFHYYDRKRERWEVTTTPKEDDQRNLELPDFLEVTFETEDEEPQQSYIFLPKPKASAAPTSQSKASTSPAPPTKPSSKPPGN